MMSTQRTAKQEKKEGMIETFMSGAKKGWGIAINTIMPAMVLWCRPLLSPGLWRCLATCAGRSWVSLACRGRRLLS